MATLPQAMQGLSTPSVQLFSCIWSATQCRTAWYCMISSTVLTGCFTDCLLPAYRADPNLLDTLEAYDGTVDFLHGLEMDDDALTKAIIGTMGDLDAYQLPDAKGYTAFSRSACQLREPGPLPVGGACQPLAVSLLTQVFFFAMLHVVLFPTIVNRAGICHATNLQCFEISS